LLDRTSKLSWQLRVGDSLCGVYLSVSYFVSRAQVTYPRDRGCLGLGPRLHRTGCSVTSSATRHKCLVCPLSRPERVNFLEWCVGVWRLARSPQRTKYRRTVTRRGTRVYDSRSLRDQKLRARVLHLQWHTCNGTLAMAQHAYSIRHGVYHSLGRGGGRRWHRGREKARWMTPPHRNVARQCDHRRLRFGASLAFLFAASMQMTPMTPTTPVTYISG